MVEEIFKIGSKLTENEIELVIQKIRECCFTSDREVWYKKEINF